MDTSEVPQVEIVQVGEASPDKAGIMRDDRGRLADADAGRLLSRQRWDRYQEALERGAADGANTASAEAAVEKIMSVTAARAVSKDDPKQLEAAREVMTRLMGQAEGKDADGDLTFTAKVPASAVGALAEALSLARSLRAEQV